MQRSAAMFTDEGEAAPLDDSADNLYLNINIVNSVSATALKNAVYSQRLNRILLDHPDEFKMCFARFSVPITAIPWFSVATNQYQITLAYNGTNFTRSVVIPSYSTAQPQQAYYVHQFLDGVNTALATAFAALVNQNPGAFQMVNAPFFSFNDVTQLITLVTDTGVWDQNAVQGAAILCNTPLAMLFGNIPQKFFTYNAGTATDSQFIIVTRDDNTRTNPVPQAQTLGVLSTALTAGTAVTALAVSAGTLINTPAGASLSVAGDPTHQVFLPTTQHSVGAVTIAVPSTIPYSTSAVGSVLLWNGYTQTLTSAEAVDVSTWNQACSVVVTTQVVPVRMEDIPSYQLNGGNPSDISSQPIISDFLYPETERISGTSNLVFVPQTELRWVDLNSHEPWGFPDFRFNWSDFSGNINPIQLEPAQACTAKILFRRKVETVAVDSSKTIKGGNLAEKKRKRLL